MPAPSGPPALRLLCFVAAIATAVVAVALGGYAVLVPFDADGDYGRPVSLWTRLMLVALLGGGAGAMAYASWGFLRYAGGNGGGVRWARVAVAAVAGTLAVPVSFVALLVVYSGG